MSLYATSKILSAIKECDKFINKEAPRNADTRPADVLDLLNRYIAQRAKLVAMLDEA